MKYLTRIYNTIHGINQPVYTELNQATTVTKSLIDHNGLTYVAPKYVFVCCAMTVHYV